MAETHVLADGKVKVSALVAGDGIDLVVKPLGGRNRTIQLTQAEARALARACLASANESERLNNGT